MAHRGRLNVLVNIVGKSYGQLFREFEDYVSPDAVQGSGDVKYHLGQSGKFVSRAGNEIVISLAANPSHLETVDPVVVGMARARMDEIRPGQAPTPYPVLPVLVHGDAAFAGQGVVAETLNLSNIRGYRVGGTVHVVINNQVGFTTSPEAARSSYYPTDVAKMVQAPIFHVNGDDPEACVRVAHLAFGYRQRFNKDVVIDMVCYRRFGHNETDDPSYTQPAMYRRIDARRSVRKLYVESLVKRGDITLDEAEQALDGFQEKLQLALDETRQAAPAEQVVASKPKLVGVLPHVATGVPVEQIERVYEALTSLPPDFTLHAKLARQFEARDKMYRSGQVDWALGEAFAFGTLLLEGTSVRLAGQDSRRGTFSHRHATLIDYETEREHTPLAGLGEESGAHLWLYDSLLSEYAALGFEYGYTVVNKDALVMWEAQFGDFINGAQIIIDQFLVAAEDKWGQTSGLTLLLPHGYEGQGPEHSSARIERFLTLAAEDNIQAANPTTSAQYFHLLRRQMARDVRKPLIVFTPKALLRARFSHSPVEAFTRRLLRGGARRPDDRRGSGRGRPAGRALLRQGRRRRLRSTGEAGPRRCGGDRAGRAALPVALRRGGRRARALCQRPRGGLAAGGAGEHGAVERAQGAPLRPPRRHARHHPGQPGGVGQPRLGQPPGPRSGEGAAVRRGVRRSDLT